MKVEVEVNTNEIANEIISGLSPLINGLILAVFMKHVPVAANQLDFGLTQDLSKLLSLLSECTKSHFFNYGHPFNNPGPDKEEGESETRSVFGNPNTFPQFYPGWSNNKYNQPQPLYGLPNLPLPVFPQFNLVSVLQLLENSKLDKFFADEEMKKKLKEHIEKSIAGIVSKKAFQQTSTKDSKEK